MWYKSLTHLLQNIRDGDKWRWMKDIQIPHQNEKSKNAIYPAREGETWVKYIENLERSQYEIRKLLKQSEELLNYSNVSSMRKRLNKQTKQLARWAEDAETSDYLLMTQYDELRAIRVEIRVLQYKVAALLKEKNSKGEHLFNIFRGSFSSSKKSSLSFISPKWYRRMPREKKKLVRKIMANDIINGTLSEETVTRVCSTFRVSRDELKALARYLGEKYKLTDITKPRTV